MQILRVQHQTELTGERIKIFEFFSKAAELLEFDLNVIREIIQGPWEEQAQSEQQLILSQAFILNKNSTRHGENSSIPVGDSLMQEDLVKRISLNQVSGFLESQELQQADSNNQTPLILPRGKKSRCDSNVPGSERDEGSQPRSPLTRFAFHDSMATKSRAAKAEIMLQDDSIFEV